jgi:hypothetical protein
LRSSDAAGRAIGYRERIAKRDGVWRNTILMERRSAVIGTEWEIDAKWKFVNCATA